MALRALRALRALTASLSPWALGTGLSPRALSLCVPLGSLSWALSHGYGWVHGARVGGLGDMPHPLPVCRAHAKKLAWTSMLHFTGDAALVPAGSNITAAVFARRRSYPLSPGVTQEGVPYGIWGSGGASCVP